MLQRNLTMMVSGLLSVVFETSERACTTNQTHFACAGSYIDVRRRQALDYTAKIEELAVEGNGLPYRIPRRYNR